jgi:hypothetical protein
MLRISGLLLLVVLCGCNESGTAPAAPTTPTPTPTPTPAPAPPPPPAPTTVATLVVNPSNIGSQSRSVGTVTLTASAPAGGAAVGLESKNRSVATVPATFTIPEGQSSGTFNIESNTVATRTPVDIIASYGGVSNGATLTVDPQPLQAIPRVNPRNSYPCGIAGDGKLGQWVDIYPCTFDGSLSSGDPVYYRWYLRTSVGRFEWQTSDKVSVALSTCAVFTGHPQSSPGRIEIEVGLQVDDKFGKRSAVATTTMTLVTQRSCGFPN